MGLEPITFALLAQRSNQIELYGYKAPPGIEPGFQDSKS